MGQVGCWPVGRVYEAKHQMILMQYIMPVFPTGFPFFGQRVFYASDSMGAAFNPLTCRKIAVDTGSFKGRFGISIGFFQNPREVFALINCVITDFFYIKDHTTDAGKAMGDGSSHPFT